MSKICPNCQTTNRDTSRFCMNCATPLEGSATGGTPVSGPTSPDSGGSQPNLQTGMMPPESRLQNRYIIVRRLGRGGMGAVYAASDARITGKLWAVKEMSDAAITNPLEKQQAIGAFRQEAEMLARLNHPNLPAVTDFFSEGGKQYLVMELVAGQTLEALLAARPGPFPEAQVLDWVNQLCDVLNYLHNQQPPIVFRDLKPSNIMLEDSGRIKLIDFGIARLFKPGRASDTQAMGTPGYAAPEQYGRGQTDARSDVYSLGVVMHNLLTKHDPSLNPFNFLPVRQLNPAVSPQVEAVIVRALRANPAERYQSVLEMRAALRGSTPPEGLAAPTPAPAGMATVVEPASYTPPGQIPPAGYTPAGGIPQPAYPPAGYTPPQPLPQPSPAPPRKGMPGWVWAAGGLLALILCVVVALTALAIGSQADGGSPFAFLGGGGQGNNGSGTSHLDPTVTLTPTESMPTASATGYPIISPTSTTTTQPTSTQNPTFTPTPFKTSTATPIPTPTSLPGPGTLSTNPSDDATLVFIPGGQFTMGLTSTQVDQLLTICADCTDNIFNASQPAHPVELDSYWIYQTEVTNDMYARCVAAGSCSPPAGSNSSTRENYWSNPAYAQHPVVLVDWFSARDYCSWAGGRLPTEAEWEYAARGDDDRLFPWGNLPPSPSLANVGDPNGDTTAVGSYPEGSSPFGVLDMAGNVWEWVNDWYEADYYARSPVPNPTGPNSSSLGRRVGRGGAWFWDGAYASTAYHDWWEPQNTGTETGFRCAIPVE